MNYFSELLESYSKLKKRTYKITFISEDSQAAIPSEQAAKAAGEIVAAAREVQAKGKGEILEGLGANGTVAIGFSEQGKLYARVGSRNLMSKPYSAFINAFSSPRSYLSSQSNASKVISAWIGGGEQTDDQKRSEELQQKSEEQLEKDRNRTIEGSVEGTAYMTVAKILQTGYSQIQKLIKDKIIDMSDEVALAQYVKGNYDTARGGFLKQILEGEVRKINADGTDSVRGGSPSPAQAESMARKFNILATSPGIEQGSPEAKRFCSQVSNEDNPLIGMYKDKPVIYGADKTETLVFPTVNKILDGALDQIEKLCGKTRGDLSQVPTDTVNSQALNGIRGTFFEDISVFVINIKAAKTQEERKQLAEDFKSLIRSKRSDLEKIVARYGDPNGPTLDLELFGQAEYQTELLEVLNSAPAFKAYLYKEMSLVNGFVDSIGATSADRTGGGKAAGGDRDDILVYFDSKEAAEAAGKILDVEPYEEDGEFKISLGSKRYTASTDGKLGEVNSDDQLTKNMDPNFKGDKNYNAEGMRPRILKELFGWDGRDFTFDDAMEKWENTFNYYKGIQDKVDKLKSSFIETEAYSLNGKVRLQTPKARAEALLERLQKTTGYDDLEASPLQDVLYTTNSEGKLELINLEDQSTRERLAEKVGRMYKMQQLDKGLKDETTAENARNAAMLMAYSSGGNVRDLSQVFTTDDYTIAFSQTGLIRDLAQSKTKKVEISGFTINITDGKKKLKIGLERSGKNTRTVTKTNEESMKEVGKFYSGEGEQIGDSIERILKGQINLLEAFLNQTSDNPLL